MTDQPQVNSPLWWEYYFKSEWEAHGGRAQTRAFSQAAVDGLAVEESYWLAQVGRTMCDWGCAMGDGVALLAQAFPRAEVCGLDAAQTAILAARVLYPALRFGSVWDELVAESDKFDALLCSNCLEHFDDPRSVVAEHLQHVRDVYVVLVPYRETPLSETHRRSWDEHTLPEAVGEFVRLYWKLVPIDPTIWPAGEQLLMVYGSKAYRSQRQALSATAQEKAKWDAIYADMPLIDISRDDVVTAFNEELLDILTPLLDRGSKVLEAGCGGGAQSLTLAQRGGYEVSLLDFSPNALDYARRLFAQHGERVRTIEADAFAVGPAEYDLVFNAGVLEHYSFDEQVRFLKGMASRSKRYVMVLIPNRACYWYWVWRMQKASSGQWPYGKEVPLVDMQAIFEAAGLCYLGQSFLGRRWSQSFVEGLEGLSDELRALILQAQRSSILPSPTEGYLVAALGAVTATEHLPPTNIWSRAGVTELRVQADQTALLADSIANVISASAELRRSNLEVALVRRESAEQRALWQQNMVLLEAALGDAKQREASARVEAERAVAQAHERSFEAQQAALLAVQEAHQRAHAVQIEALRQIESVRHDEAAKAQLATDRMKVELDAALAQVQAQTQEAQTEYARRIEMNRVLAQMRSSLSWRITKPMRLIMRVLRHGWLPQDKARLRQIARAVFHKMPVPVSVRHALRNTTVSWLGTHSRSAAPSQAPAVTNTSNEQGWFVAHPTEGLPDYFFWGVIDWHLRYQRPQHLAKGLTEHGRRVFYISSELRKGEEPSFDLEPLDASGRLLQVFLRVRKPISIYSQLPSAEMLVDLRLSVGALMRHIQTANTIQVVQHPFWTEVATVIPNSRCAYDCMDHHAGFDNTAPTMVDAEQLLIRRCDDVTVTSQWLLDEVAKYRRPTHLVRNGCEYDHFAIKPAIVYADPRGRKIIGYYGAIAPWLDLTLLRCVALANPDAVILMIGADTTEAQSQLADVPNIEWVGEISYAQLPYYAHSFDVALLPFKVMPLTLATNPVKVYEYLSMGLEVVCIELPETLAFTQVAQVAATSEAFVAAVSAALNATIDPIKIRARQDFALSNTWDCRVEQLLGIFEPPALERKPQISVVVVTYNNIDLTRACLASLESNSPLEALEIIVVDNASGDGTPAMLQEWQAQGRWRRLILNAENRGFAAANNQGLSLSTGDYLCLLNNDTYTTSGWASTLKRFLQQHPDVGLAGPVTNNIGNEARIDIEYADMAEMAQQAFQYTTRHIGQLLDLKAAAFFCVMLTRSTFEKVGNLDEVYGLGFFEDDDYCMRIRKAGLRVVCVEDVFVHHHLSASFDKLPSKARQDLMAKNKALYESKWGKWEPHAYR
ncbi:MAG: glycosyltransferase [Rhodoferax sp.]|uniref:glycosyltransferase n=1 Tax=Rhodoferax sp. TaxID=50421 RepID=UPI0026399435|nr:glycosyltransferase [Rhodoferax sp.]MDD5333699.1 glycosyltransferase [Rhodoferax sp.]